MVEVQVKSWVAHLAAPVHAIARIMVRSRGFSLRTSGGEVVPPARSLIHLTRKQVGLTCLQHSVAGCTNGWYGVEPELRSRPSPRPDTRSPWPPCPHPSGDCGHPGSAAA